MKPFKRGVLIPPSLKQMKEIAETDGVSLEEVKAEFAREAREAKVFVNDLYQVSMQEYEVDGQTIVHLSIKRKDKRPVINWQHKQMIKSALVGPENEGVELFPAESRLLDKANQYHLWVFKDPTARIPLGFHDKRQVGYSTGEFFKQRPPEGFDEKNNTKKKAGSSRKRKAPG